jgi:hypothetical protein
MAAEYLAHALLTRPLLLGWIISPLPGQLLGDLATSPSRMGLFQLTHGLLNLRRCLIRAMVGT